ncbi:uncharacterized protein LOC112087743 [Eutrema salsugineum]|uniref:uncharacterized protein LOC112087743 n=1 Tax=Eutrema salsugineum TaxID=72664 RepID=UPI000CED70C2|nr:uncharacterized protein LOC112087743 [Eutrema salsugineum]
MGRLIDLTGSRGTIDLGVPINATVTSAFQRRSRRRWNGILTDTVQVIEAKQAQLQPSTSDIPFWKDKAGKFKTGFSSKNTWLLLRHSSPRQEWHKGVWFKHCTPKYYVCTWLASLNRLSTGNRMMQWNPGINPSCSLCNSSLETRDHLFFECNYTREVSSKLATTLFQSRF